MLGFWTDVSWILMVFASAGAAAPCLSGESVSRTAATATLAKPEARPWGPCITAFDRGLAPVLEGLWAYSPTYQRQCRELAKAKVIVSLRMAPQKDLRGYRALSQIGRVEGGRLVMHTRIMQGGPLDELISHELEHALERLEGLRFETRASGGRGWRTSEGAFETNRAIDAGREAQNEMHRRPNRGLQPGRRREPAPVLERATSICAT